jgi:hypothetical protein
MGKSWTERMNAPAEIVVKPAPVDIAGMRAGQVMLVPTTRLIAEFMAGVPCGEHVTVVAMRAELARRHEAEVTCPIYTGYHLRTVAEAALEAHAAGVPVEAITPFWRVLDETSPTTGRLPNGVAFVRERRAAEQWGG